MSIGINMTYRILEVLGAAYTNTSSGCKPEPDVYVPLYIVQKLVVGSDGLMQKDTYKLVQRFNNLKAAKDYKRGLELGTVGRVVE